MTQKPQVHLYFTYGSSYSYLAWARITRVHPERYANADLLWKPVQFSKLMQLQGHDGGGPANQTPYARKDVERWAHAYGVPLRYASCYPVDSSNASKAHLLAEMEGPAMEAAWLRACFEAHWVHDRDISDPAVLDDIAHAVGMRKVSDRIGSDGIKRLLDANTHEAVQAGAPGVPYAVVAGEGFWGNDRLAWAEKALGVHPAAEGP
jgi:2-hydroxychromene-2-carboxylate isomerase